MLGIRTTFQHTTLLVLLLAVAAVQGARYADVASVLTLPTNSAQDSQATSLGALLASQEVFVSPILSASDKNCTVYCNDEKVEGLRADSDKPYECLGKFKAFCKLGRGKVAGAKCEGKLTAFKSEEMGVKGSLCEGLGRSFMAKNATIHGTEVIIIRGQGCLGDGSFLMKNSAGNDTDESRKASAAMELAEALKHAQERPSAPWTFVDHDFHDDHKDHHGDHHAAHHDADGHHDGHHHDDHHNHHGSFRPMGPMMLGRAPHTPPEEDAKFSEAAAEAVRDTEGFGIESRCTGGSGQVVAIRKKDHCAAEQRLMAATDYDSFEAALTGLDKDVPPEFFLHYPDAPATSPKTLAELVQGVQDRHMDCELTCNGRKAWFKGYAPCWGVLQLSCDADDEGPDTPASSDDWSVEASCKGFYSGIFGFKCMGLTTTHLDSERGELWDFCSGKHGVGAFKKPGRAAMVQTCRGKHLLGLKMDDDE